LREIERVLLKLNFFTSPHMQDTTIISRLLLLLYMTPEIKWKFFEKMEKMEKMLDTFSGA